MSHFTLERANEKKLVYNDRVTFHLIPRTEGDVPSHAEFFARFGLKGYYPKKNSDQLTNVVNQLHEAIPVDLAHNLKKETVKEKIHLNGCVFCADHNVVKRQKFYENKLKDLVGFLSLIFQASIANLHAPMNGKEVQESVKFYGAAMLDFNR